MAPLAQLLAAAALGLRCLCTASAQEVAPGEESAPLATLLYNFTLAAVNTTLPNDNATGAPLVLGAGGASGGIAFYVTSTYASFPYNDHPALGLVGGALRAYDPSGAWRTNASRVLPGERLGWSTSTRYPNPEERNRVYAALPAANRSSTEGAEEGSGFARLTAHGVDEGMWALCPFPGFRGQTQLVWNVTAVRPPPAYLPFDPYACYDVAVNIVPV